MKKITTLLLAAAMAASAVSVMPAAAADSPKNIVILGDSIAAGYGLSENEANYGKICGDYYGCSVDNFAVSGLTSTQLLDGVKNMTNVQKTAFSKADVFVISIGGNDMIQYAAKVLLQFAGTHQLLKNGLTIADIPENPTAIDLKNMLDLKGFKSYVTNGGTGALMEMTSLLSKITNNLTQTSGENAGIIPNEVIKNINDIVSEIKKNNSSARIIIQTLYQPVQLDPTFVEKNFGSGNYEQVLKQVRINFNDVINTSFNTELKKLSGVEIADVYYTFTANESGKSTAKNPGHSYYFTDIQEIMEAGGSALGMDFHPNKAGNMAIAATIINTIGAKETDGGLLAKAYNELLTKNDYPVVAWNELFSAMKISLGDIDRDETVDSADASKILLEYSYIVNGESGEMTEVQKAAADLNKDSTIDSSDASLALQYYAYVMNKGTLSLQEFLDTEV